METLTNGMVVLKQLTVSDREMFYQLYTDEALTAHFGQSPFLAGETDLAFTKRIIASCDFIWTIRQQQNPAIIIGDCALHHYDSNRKTIQIGGSLLPVYWGKDIMKQAFELLITFIEQALPVEQILGKTSPHNRQAIRLVEKLGFQPVGIVENEMVLSKKLLPTPC
jgi:ribosomal-protein-alanine N-acetyltransferase